MLINLKGSFKFLSDFDTDGNGGGNGNNGSPILQNGFIDYNDTQTASTNINIPANEWGDIPNDGLGSFSNNLFPPQGVSSLLDTPQGDFNFSELNLGDIVLIRNDFSVIPSVNFTLLEVRYELGVGNAPYTLSSSTRRLDIGSGVPYKNDKAPFLIYMGDTNTKDFPCKLQVRLSNEGTLVNSGTVVWVNRR